MKDQDKAKEQLTNELAEMRQQAAQLQTVNTERKRAEEELRESEERFRSIFENATIGLYRTTPDGRILMANPALVRMLGYPSFEELARRNLEAEGFEPGYPREAFKERMESEGQIIGLESAWVKPDGTTLFIRESARAIRDEAGNTLYYEGAIEDITERKRAEEALAHERDLLQALMDSIPDTIYFKDTASRFTKINRAQAQVLGLSDPKEGIGKTDFDFFTPEHAQDAYADEQEIVKSGQPLMDKVERIRRANGQVRWVSATKVPIIDEEGQVVGTVGISRDITERRQAQEEIERRNRELAALNAIIAAMMQSALDLDEVLQRTADGIVKGLGCNTGLILLLDEKEEVFKGSAVSTKANILERLSALIGSPLLQIKIPVRRDASEAISNLLNGRITIKHDFYELVKPFLSRQMCSAMQRLLDSKSFFAVPLLAKGKTVGAIVASTPEKLSEADAEKLMTFANQAAIAIENARLYTEAQRRALEQETLREAALALTTALNRNRVIGRILAQLQQVVPFDSASVQLLRGEQLEIVGGRGFPNLPDLLGMTFPTDGDNPNREVIRTLSPFILKDAPALYEGFTQEPFAAMSIRSWLGVPMLIGDRPVGVITLDKREPDFYTQEHARLAEAFAAQAAVAIENARLFEEEKRRSTQLAFINEVGEKAASILDSDRLMQEVTRSIQESFNYYNVALLLLDEERREVVLQAIAGGFEHVAAGEYRQSIDKGIIGFVARTGRPWLASDVSEDPYYIKGPSEHVLTESELCVPIKLGENVIGVLLMQSIHPNDFDQADVVAMEAVADRVAIAIENARLFEEIEERRMYLEAVLGAAPDAIVTLDVHSRIAEWNPGAERLFGYSREEAIGQNIDHLITKPNVFEEAVGFTQAVMAGGEVPPSETIRYRKDGSPVDVIAAGSPIKARDGLMGTVAVYTDITARVRMEETLRALALIDDLTNLYNRRGFVTLGQQQLKVANRTNSTMVLLFADFDGLKEINDVYGHPEGDRALIEVANILRETFRESDIIARIGGDEFVVLAIETNAPPTEVFATRFQERLKIRNTTRSCRYELSLSMGLAHYDPKYPCSIDDLLAQADKAMYDKKRGDTSA